MIHLKNLCLFIFFSDFCYQFFWPFAEAGVKVFAGGLHTCAILVDNSTKCWGWGFYGQLGSGATDNIGDELDELLGGKCWVFETPALL